MYQFSAHLLLRGCHLRWLHFSFQKLFPHHVCCFMFAGMAPSRGHYQVQKFILNSGCLFYIVKQGCKFAEIHIGKIIRVHLSRYTIFNRDLFFFSYICSKNLIPYIEQVAEIGIHIIRIAGMVNTVMRWRKNDIIQKAKPCVF